jgi:hypothetical protein
MKTLREKLYEITYENTQVSTPKISLTPVQKLQAENEKRREELDSKREKLQDKKTLRSIGSIVASPYISGMTAHTVTGLSGKSGVKGQEYTTSGRKLANKTEYNRYRI